jgi:hypothetical protein
MALSGLRPDYNRTETVNWIALGSILSLGSDPEDEPKWWVRNHGERA